MTVENTQGLEKHEFAMGDNIQFKLSYKVFQKIRSLYVSIMLRSGINGEVVTSVIHPISSKGLKENAEGTVAIEFPNVYIRPGEYPLYFWLGDLTKPVPVLDVVENLTAPLVVNTGENKIEQGF